MYIHSLLKHRRCSEVRVIDQGIFPSKRSAGTGTQDFVRIHAIVGMGMAVTEERGLAEAAYRVQIAVEVPRPMLSPSYKRKKRKFIDLKSDTCSMVHGHFKTRSRFIVNDK